MLLSVIICTRNRAEYLQQTLAAMADLSVPKATSVELIVVDNASTDETEAIIKQCCLPQMSVNYVHEVAKGLSHARNKGIATARGQIIVFTDDDVCPSPIWLQELVKPIMIAKADAVLGKVHIPPKLLKPWMEAYHQMMFSSTEDVNPVNPFSLVGANMAFSRDVLIKVPAFDVEMGAGNLGFGEDTLFSLQLKQSGYKIATAFDAQVEHRFDPSRLTRKHLLARAAGEGRYLAYLAHHWEHHEIPQASLLLMKRRFRLLYWRMLRYSECLGKEGVAVWEMQVIQTISFYKQFIIERERPRNYAKYGLIKLKHDSN